MRTGSASLIQGLDGSLFLKGWPPILWTGPTPPNFVGSKSPTLRSSILRSPSAVSIFVPFRKQAGVGQLLSLGEQAVAAVFARTTEPKITPIRMMLRRVRREVWPESSRSAVKVVLLVST